MSPYHVAVILSFSSVLSGCDGLTILEGKPSPFKAEVERRAAITLPSPSEPSPVDPVIVPEQVVDVPEPVPSCIIQWRVSDCVNGESVPWVW